MKTQTTKSQTSASQTTASQTRATQTRASQSPPPPSEVSARRPGEGQDLTATESLLTVKQAAERLGSSESTLWRLIRRGALPSVLRSGRRLIPSEALANAASHGRDGEPPPFGPDHPIFRLVGAGKSGGVGPGARDKYSILAP